METETEMVFEGIPRGDIEDKNPITGEVSIYNYGSNNNYVRPPKDPNIPPPVPIVLEPEDLPGYWKLEDRHRYLSQLKESDGFDVESPPVGVCGAISPINHHMEVCVRMARLAVDEFNRRHNGSELQFIQIIKVMGKAANGIQYYITGEAKFPISKRPSTFQAVTQTGVKGTEVRSFRFVSGNVQIHRRNHGCGLVIFALVAITFEKGALLADGVGLLIAVFHMNAYL